VGLVVFGASLVLVVAIGLFVDRAFQLPVLCSGAASVAVGATVFVAGAVLCGWCVVRFRRAAGTPVPMNPPSELVVEGPYRWTRNPMLTGVFTSLFGLGILLHSTGMVAIAIPAYILLHVVELKLVEEPELERRFGVGYLEYKSRVPMFWPRPWRVARRAG
jgi:protein-S-isoprenylcysteine O-methyltransferase Ste14